jgi:hypothetical protein
MMYTSVDIPIDYKPLRKAIWKGHQDSYWKYSSNRMLTNALFQTPKYERVYGSLLSVCQSSACYRSEEAR